MSVKELQKDIAEIKKEKVNPKEPPSHTPIATSGQPQGKVSQDTSAKVDSIVIVTITIEELVKDQTR